MEKLLNFHTYFKSQEEQQLEQKCDEEIILPNDFTSDDVNEDELATILSNPFSQQYCLKGNSLKDDTFVFNNEANHDFNSIIYSPVSLLSCKLSEKVMLRFAFGFFLIFSSLIVPTVAAVLMKNFAMKIYLQF